MGIKTGLYKFCESCNKKFWVYRSREHEKKFCCMSCYRKSQIGRTLSPNAKRIAIETLNIHRGKNPPKGETHSKWLGDKAGYRAKHYWVIRMKGKASECSLCGKSEGRIQWANIDHSYRRDINDYFPACPSCHKRFDIKMREINHG